MEDNNVIKLDLSQFGKQEESPAPTVGETNEPVASADTVAEVPGNQVEEPAHVTPKNEAGDYVVNLNPNPQNNAVQEQQTEEVPVQPEAESSEEVREPQLQEEPTEILERIEEEPTEVSATHVSESEVMEALEQVTPEEETGAIINDPTPEGINKFVEFMNDTGLEGTEAMEAYVNLNKDPEKMDARELLTDYYKANKPFLNDDQIQKQLNKKFSYDPDNTDVDKIEEINIAFQEELYKAQQFQADRKEKYYTDLKLRQQHSLPPDAQEAVEFYSDYKQSQEKQTQTFTTIKKQIDQVFNEDFKGFDFKVGDAKYRFKVNDPVKQKESHKDFAKVFGNYIHEDGTLKDAVGYNKALFAAQNADKLAQHFYEQGRADAVRESARKSKNIDMGVREDNSAVVTPSGQKVRVVTGDSKSKFKPKMTIKGWNN